MSTLCRRALPAPCAVSGAARRLPLPVRLLFTQAALALLLGADAAALMQARPTVAFSRAGGTFAEPFLLTLTAEPGAEIRYTTDGSDPTGAGALRYDAPLRIAESVRIRAVAVHGGAAGRVTSAAFIQLAPELAGYTSTLPILVIENFGAGSIPRKPWNQVGSGVRQVPRQTAVWAFFDRVEGVGALGAAPQLMSTIGIRGRGAFSSTWPQKPYSVEAMDERGGEQDVAPLGMPAHSDWVLYYPDGDTVATEPQGLGLPLNDATLLFNSFAWELSGRMGRPAVRFRWVETFINEDGGPLALRHRRGVYAVVEKVSRGANRLNFRRLSADGSSGGWLLAINRMDPEPETGWPARNGATRPQFFHTAGRNRIHETPPNERGRGDDEPRAGNAFLNFENPNGYTINVQQRAAIEDWFRAYEDALWNDTIWRDPVAGYRRYIDERDFIDFFMLHELTRNGDGLGLSIFPWKGDDGLLRLGPVWDFNWSAYFNRTLYTPAGARIVPEPRVEVMHQSWGLWFPRLFSDPDFHAAYLARWYALRAGPLSDSAMAGIIDRQAADITGEKAVLNGIPSVGEWTRRLEQMKEWLSARAGWLDEQYRCPAWSRDLDNGVRCRVLVTTETLQLLAPSAACGSCEPLAPLRLEGMLADASVSGSVIPVQTPVGPHWRFAGQASEWQPVRPWNPTVAPLAMMSSETAARLSLTEGSRNLNGIPVGGIVVELPDSRLSDYGALVVRARGNGVLRMGPRYNLREGSGTPTDAPNPFLYGGPDLPIVDDVAFRDYRLSLAWAPDSVRQLGLWFATGGGAGSIDIESIRLEPIEASFRETGHGARVMRDRQAVFVHAPASLTWRVHVPPDGWFGVGLGILRAGAPATFTISVQPPDAPPQRLLRATVTQPGEWVDHVIGLHDYAGREVTLILEATGDAAGTVALWAEPTLGGSTRRAPER